MLKRHWPTAQYSSNILQQFRYLCCYNIFLSGNSLPLRKHWKVVAGVIYPYSLKHQQVILIQRLQPEHLLPRRK